MNEWILDVRSRAVATRHIYRIGVADWPDGTWEVVAQLPDQQQSVLREGLPDRAAALAWMGTLLDLDTATV